MCVFCGRSHGAQFAIFSPRFQPFGTACTDCEETLPEGTKLPCTHNTMVATGDPQFAWKCAVCGYIYGTFKPQPQPQPV